MKTNKTYTFAVPCSYVYEIEAETQEKAKEILIEKGGWDISGELCLESEDYKNATCLDSPTEELTEKQILGEIDNLERELEHYELYEPEDLDAICSLENKLNTFNVKLKTMVFDYLKKTYPKSDYTDEDLTKDEYYNDVFFEMVFDVREKFLNEKQDDATVSGVANEMVEEYMDKNNF